MDIGKPLIEYGPADITELREQMLLQDKSFWDLDQANRVVLARNRPGNAVFFYNDMPACVDRTTLQEADCGYVNVLRYPGRPLFLEVQGLIEACIAPHFPDCDIMRVQLAELPPSAVITPHRDLHILAAVHRLHIPVVTHPGVKFIIADQSFFLESGFLYDLNNAVLHSVENNSDVMRVHLMVDMMPHALSRARYHDSEGSMISAVSATKAAQARRNRAFAALR
jgi:hypothetical protein